jgi:hypothetical protein
VLWRAKFRFLGRRIRRGLAHAQVISAESNHSLDRLRGWGCSSPFLSVNGSDDELKVLRSRNCEPSENVAVVVGTYTYRAVGESFRVYQALRQQHPELKLLVIGDAISIPARLHSDPDVVICGPLGREKVLERLRQARYFINTTYAENSYNCAAEGVFLAAQSYISPIPPHLELLAGESHDAVNIRGVDRQLLYVERNRLRGVNLESWDEVICSMNERVEQELERLDRIEAKHGLPAQHPTPWLAQESR